MVTVVSAQVRVPAALLGTHARLCAARGVVAVGLTWKFSTNGEVVLVQLTWPTKLGAVVPVGAPQPVPFWNTRPLCQKSVMVTGLRCAFATVTWKLTNDPGFRVAVVPPPVQFPGLGQIVLVIVVAA